MYYLDESVVQLMHLESDRYTGDVSPFSSTFEALLFMLVNSPRPIVHWTKIIVLLACVLLFGYTYMYHCVLLLYSKG